MCHLRVGLRWCHGSNGFGRCVASSLEALWTSEPWVGSQSARPMPWAPRATSDALGLRTQNGSPHLRQPPAARQIPPGALVSSVCCPRNLFLPPLNTLFRSSRVAPTTVPLLHALLYRHTPQYRILIAECDGHIVILDAAHTDSPGGCVIILKEREEDQS
jgi:hypothetical protein